MKLFEHDLNSHKVKSDFPERSPAISHSEASCSKLSLVVEKPSLRLLKRNIQATSQNYHDITEINYSQFRNKLIENKNYNSTFQKDNFIIQGNVIEIKMFIKYSYLLFVLYILYIYR